MKYIEIILICTYILVFNLINIFSGIFLLTNIETDLGNNYQHNAWYVKLGHVI